MGPESDGISPPPPPRIALGAIVRNEGPYLLEWIAHHRALGIDRFLIADNDSTDETTAVLAALAAAGIVEHLPFPSVPGVAPQLAAYEAILDRAREAADWIAFLDADEFLVPAPPHRSLAAVIAGLAPGPEVGAIAVNWALYGSSGIREAESAPVAERFVRRAERAFPGNHHYKSIVRAGAPRPPVLNPHYFVLANGLRTIHPDGTEVADAPHQARGLSARLYWEPLRINHYVVKSWDEFHYRKRTRGRATGAPQRDAGFFAVHDRNDVLDPMPSWLVAAGAAEADRIEAAVRMAADPPGWTARLRALLGAGHGPAGAVEAVEISGDAAHLRGWAIAADGLPATDFAITLDGRPVAVEGVVRSRRCDIVARLPEAPAGCGFLVKIAWPPAPDGVGRSLVVTARRGAGGAWDLSAAKARWSGLPPGPVSQPEAGGQTSSKRLRWRRSK